jgi:hypothetical protein
MGRHIIINTQPGDQSVDGAVTKMRNKPLDTNGRWTARLDFKLDSVHELDLTAEDKVYLVGHGDPDKGTLGGRPAIELANAVRKHVLPAGQINLVMCGSCAVVNSARSFTKQLQDGDDGYKGKVFAYVAPLEFPTDDGSKMADAVDEYGKADYARAGLYKVDLTENPPESHEDSEKQ